MMQWCRFLRKFLALTFSVLMIGSLQCACEATESNGTSGVLKVISSMSKDYVLSEMDQRQAGVAVHPSHLIRCINNGYNSTGLSWASAMNSKSDLGSVKVIGSWWSTRSSGIPVTLVTQQSYTRLNQLRAQCKSWSGPLSTVMYTSLIQDGPGTGLSSSNRAHLGKILHHVALFIDEVESNPRMCALDILLVYELFTDQPASMLYPFNMLRNLARLQARTPVLAMFDGDLTVSRLFSEKLSHPETASSIVKDCALRSLFVIPCFEATRKIPFDRAVLLADSGALAEKQELVDLVDAGELMPFHLHRFRKGHQTTDYRKWYTAVTSYPVIPSKGYEPYVLIDRLHAPWHDVRFRGYGSDKVTYIAHLNYTGYEFKVHPEGWVIHRPHERSAASDAFFASLPKSWDHKYSQHENTMGLQLRRHVQRLEKEVTKLVRRGDYKPVLDVATRDCLKSLPWW